MTIRTNSTGTNTIVTNLIDHFPGCMATAFMKYYRSISKFPSDQSIDITYQPSSYAKGVTLLFSYKFLVIHIFITP